MSSKQMINKTLSVVFIFALLMSLSTCKKYDEGGLINLRLKHIFGGKYDGAKKNWKLKSYEVNGIDSTSLIQGGNLVINPNNDFIVFHLIDKKNHYYEAQTLVYNFNVGIDKTEIGLGTLLYSQNNDSSQCFQISNQQVCQRNIFNPEKNVGANWNILKLTKEEFILSTQLNNKYKIILIQ